MDCASYKEIDLSDLKLDTQNPRLPKSIRDSQPTEEQLIEYMLLDASLIELVIAIGMNGYFPGEQMLVVEDSDGKYRVIEGNRRLSAVKLLNNPDLAKVQKSKIQKVLFETTQRPTKIPCLVFDNEEEINKYLGYRHITGIKEWKLLEKARYLYSLRESLYADSSIDEAAREIAKMIGSKMDYVRRILIGFDIYKIIEDNGFYRIRDLDDTTFYFNYIVDSLNKTHIREFIGVDFDDVQPIEKLSELHLKKWTEWLFEKNDQNKTRLKGDSADLNALNKILGSSHALQAFDEKGYSLEKALELTGELDESFKNFIQQASKYLEQADAMTLKIDHFYSGLDTDLKTIRDLVKKIEITLSIKNDTN